MEKLKVLVTGPYGNLGTEMVKKLFEYPNVEITCFGRKSENGIKKHKKLSRLGHFKTVWGDIGDIEAIKKAVSGQNVILHTAAILVPTTEENPDLAEEVNVNALKKIVEISETMVPMPRFIFTSSIAPMGAASPDLPPRKITDPISPYNIYAKTKIQGEKILQESKLPWVILRITISLPFVMSNYMLKYLFDIALDQKVEFIDPRDTADAFVNAIFVPDEEILGKTMFIAGGEKCRITQRELLTRQFGAIGLPMPPETAFFVPKSSEEWHFMHWLDTEESQRILKYQKRSFDDYLEEFLKHFGFKRYLIKLLGKQAVKQMVKTSPYYHKNEA